MFKALSKNFNNIISKLKSGGVLTEEQINSAMREIRIALLEADVALPVVKEFVERVKQRALGQEVAKSITPGQLVVKIIHDEIKEFLFSTPEQAELNLKITPPANILMIGLQGSGKTTASAKLALYLKKQQKKVLLVSLDIYRPAAREQLQILAKNIEVDSLSIIAQENPIEIVNRAMIEAKKGMYDVVIYDSAGRLHIDEDLIKELQTIKQIINPIEILLVIDSMVGQDTVKIGNSFNEKLDITGVILSRIDGDQRGGAALSIKHAINKPIKFLSSGEHPSSLEKFDADRIASRILDMGDIVSLVETAQAFVSTQEAVKMSENFKNNKFDLNDYLLQLGGINKMGGIQKLLGMMPGANNFMTGQNIDNKLIDKQIAIICSFNKKERKNPDILNASRKKRIALGAGVRVQDINVLLKQYLQIRDMMKKVNKVGIGSMMKRGLKNIFF